MATVKQLKSLIKISGVTIGSVSDESGVAHRAIQYWFSGKTVPKDESLDRAWSAAVKLAGELRDNAAKMPARLAKVGIDLDGELERL